MVFILFVFANRSNAQTNSPYLVKGNNVVDSVTHKPVEFATILLSDSERKDIAMTYSDEKGFFQSSIIKPGSYFLTFTFVGYAPKEIPFLLTSTSSVMDIGRDFIESSSPSVGIGYCIWQSPVGGSTAGHAYLYNAERDISNQGGTAADVLRKAPILNVDAEGNVTMRGNSNLRILIKGKYSGQMARSAADALNMMPANTIKAIEVITSPSARYDAEGAAGVINIITKKGKQMSGNLEAVGGNLEQAINPRVAYSNNRWTVSSYLHLHRLRQREETSLDRITLEDGQPTDRLLLDNIRDNTSPQAICNWNMHLIFRGQKILLFLKTLILDSR